MTAQASRRGAVEMGTVLMIAAFAVIAGFLYWLSGQAAEERELGVVEDTTSGMVDEYAGATPITAADIQFDATPLEGRLVRLEPQRVASLLGQQGFMLELSTGPFLVSLSDELRADSLGVQSGDVVRVTGTITPMTPEIAASWVESGTITENDRLVAEYAVHFLAAEDVDVSTAPAAQGAQGGRGQGGQGPGGA